jgi:hypothetical protein
MGRAHLPPSGAIIDPEGSSSCIIAKRSAPFGGNRRCRSDHVYVYPSKMDTLIAV